MGFWTNLARGASYASLLVPGLQGAAPLIIGGVNALAEGVDNKAAADKATQQLQAGNNQAIGLYEQALGPYVKTGQQASNTLAGLMGLAPLGSGALQADSGFGGGMNMGAAPAIAEGPVTRQMPPDAQPIGQAQARGTAASLGLSAPASGSSFRKVRMMSPDGEEADVDEHEVSMFERAGARRV